MWGWALDMMESISKFITFAHNYIINNIFLKIFLDSSIFEGYVLNCLPSGLLFDV